MKCLVFQMSSPKMSPEKGPGFLERASSFISGRITPTLSLRGGVERLGGHGKQRNVLNNRYLGEERVGKEREGERKGGRGRER
jgi:hypothetical protein